MFENSMVRRRGLVVVAAAAAVFTAAVAYAAQDKPAAPATPAAPAVAAKPAGIDPKAQAVIDRYIEVTGGRAAYEKVKGREVRGTLEIPAQGITGTLVVKTLPPDKSMTVIDIAGMGRIERGVVGDIGWESSAMQGTRVLEGKELEQTRLGAKSESVLLELANNFTSAVVVGEVQVDGKPATQVDLDGASGKSSQFFDNASGLLVQTSMTITSPMGEIPAVTTFGDYKEVGGIKVPHLSVQSVGPMQIKTVFTEIKVNPEFGADDFKVPAELAKPATPAK